MCSKGSTRPKDVSFVTFEDNFDASVSITLPFLANFQQNLSNFCSEKEYKPTYDQKTVNFVAFLSSMYSNWLLTLNRQYVVKNHHFLMNLVNSRGSYWAFKGRVPSSKNTWDMQSSYSKCAKFFLQKLGLFAPKFLPRRVPGTCC